VGDYPPGAAEALTPFHILRPQVIRERFEYDQVPGLAERSPSATCFLSY
jgi:hypothetical protein